MIYSNAKAVALTRDLGDKLAKRLTSTGAGLNTVTTAFYTDTNGAVWPYLLIYNATAGTGTGNPVLYIEISGIDAVSKDVFNNELYAYAPHKLLLGYELGAAGNETWVTHSDLLTAEFEAIKTGVALTLLEVANGTGVTPTTMNAATAVVTLDELYWPTKLV
jgi:hypothetical protein